ncbi:MAG TPA: PQQ-dependent sugar dehydrogenase [Pyrinomonadaceae bacterium]|nr:PQQ-dependent sugar dehydrogenase [Pyrinomonadaceae bacterium]
MRLSRNYRRTTLKTALVILFVTTLLVITWRPRPQANSLLPPKVNQRPTDSSPLSASGPSFEDKGKLKEWTTNLPLAFEVNRGQADPRAKFLSRQNGSELLLTATGAILRLRDARRPFTLKFLGANPRASVNGVDQLPGYRNYLLGSDPAKWQTNVPTFGSVAYEEIYPGINLTYYGNRRDLEYDFELLPGADPDAIRLAFDAHVRPRISVNGDLVLHAGTTELIERKPVVYQEINGKRRMIEAHYVMLGNRAAGFEVGEYDRTQPLIIDPMLVYSTYLGGSGDDLGSSIAIDGSNNVYIAGTTSSSNFPTHGPAFPNTAGLSDIFVTKIDPTGGNIVYSTYIGGSGLDRADGIALDGSGNAYVVGRVGDTSTDFPTTAGALATTYRGGDFDGVLFKLNPQGNALVYSTFIGGEDNDSTEGIAVDSSGNAYITGGTRSNGFPVTSTAFQSFRTGDTDAYLTKLNSSGNAVLYSTLLGGGSTDRGSGVAVDSSGNAYVAGYSGSPDFPTQNAFQGFSGGSFDAFVAKIDTNAIGAASLVFSTYLGGIGDDKAYGIAIDNGANNVYVVGQTSSNNLPLLSPAQPAFGGSFDAFIAKISSTGTKIYATYLGGTGDDRGTGIKVNSSGEAYVTGFTSSTNFPTVTPLQISNGGGFDAFVAKLNSAGSAFLYSTYLGGSANESNTTTVTATNPLVLDASSNAYITGYTASTNFPTATPLQPASAGGQDAFVVKITDAAPAADYSISISPGSRTVVPGGATTYTVNATPVGGFTGTISLGASGFSNDSTASFNPTTIAITDASAKSSTLTVTTIAATPPGTYSLNINTTSGNLQHAGSAQLFVSGTASANLAITKTASPNPATALANLTYRITLTNNGPSPATNVAVTDQLAAGPAFVSAIPTQGTCSGAPTVTCNLGSIANGAVAIVNITITPQTPGTLTNTASVVATENDPDANDNATTIQTTVNAPASGPSMLDPNLSVKTVVSGLSQPTSMAFIGNNDFLVLEKNTGKVQRIVNGVLQSTVLDLAVNSASERGLLGIALHPNFLLTDYVYLYWTESSTGADSTNLADVFIPLSNRVDRYIWNGATLTFDRNLIKLRAYQADANQPLRGNHDGGVLRFGPDGKLYILMGDNGRRGLLQNNQLGPVPDDQFGGPEPDNNHLTGFILRLNDDGSTPLDNPFFNASTTLTGEAAANIKKLYAYGVRNGFGLAFDPLSGNLWDQENGDDAFDEMNRVTAGSNNGWVEIMGPVSRVAQYKQIETTYGSRDLQQLRWSPSLIADTPAAALASLYMLPGAHYNDPEFSWKYAIPAAPLGFVQGRGLGPQFEGDMFVGAARTFLVGGFLFRFKLTPDRLHFAFTDSRLNDLVADNLDKFDITESESLLIGRDFGITTDIETGPNGDLFVVSNTNGSVYQISGKQPLLFTANLNGAQETPPNNSTATGTATLLLSPDETTARVSLNFSGLTSAQTNAHIHGPAAPGSPGSILFPLPNSNFSDFLISPSANDVQNLKNGQLYINVHSSNFLNGEIRGQFGTSASASSVQFSSANYFVSEAAGRANITLTRIGDTSTAASVTYSTIDGAGLQNCNVTNGIASPRCDYINTLGTMTFAAGETFKTISVPLVDDAYAEGNESFTIALSNPSSAALGSPNTATVTITDNETVNGVNPIDSTNFFVRQQYIDFLNREPDPPGFTGWVNTINNCSGDTTQCDRIHVSQLFFQSEEFQSRAYFVYRFYPVAFGRKPDYAEFVPDLARVSGFLDANQLEAAKVAFIADFMARPAFANTYNGLNTQQYVDMLLNTAGVMLSSGAGVVPSRQSMIDGLNNSTLTRAVVLRQIVESAEVSTKYNHQAYAVMEYFGYLRRQPDAFYLDWIAVLDQSNDPRGMVTGFVNSIEYRQRFGP